MQIAWWAQCIPFLSSVCKAKKLFLSRQVLWNTKKLIQHCKMKLHESSCNLQGHSVSSVLVAVQARLWLGLFSYMNVVQYDWISQIGGGVCPDFGPVGPGDMVWLYTSDAYVSGLSLKSSCFFFCLCTRNLIGWCTFWIMHNDNFLHTIWTLYVTKPKLFFTVIY